MIITNYELRIVNYTNDSIHKMVLKMYLIIN